MAEETGEDLWNIQFSDIELDEKREIGRGQFGKSCVCSLFFRFGPHHSKKQEPCMPDRCSEATLLSRSSCVWTKPMQSETFFFWFFFVFAFAPPYGGDWNALHNRV